MSASELHTVTLLDLCRRYQQGDPIAGNELLLRATRRLEVLARNMLRRYPVVRAKEQTDDVLQEALTTLMGALRALDPDDTRCFYGLAAEHIRRRLIDLARKHRRGGVPASLDRLTAEGRFAPAADDDDDLDRWQSLHEAVERLDASEREVFCLRFYSGWKWPDLAELLDVSVPTARRWWGRALVRLADELGDDLPELK